ncbi:MAG TPA: hypothetical protein VH592_07075 [Gemmataceae bacterium]|jgi:hypothetical protein
MTTETLTCPYCNAAISIQAGCSAGQRIVCPRCGDSFPLRSNDSFTDRPRPSQPAQTGISAELPNKEEVPLPSRWSNRLIGCGVVCVMLFMAGGGLVFMLMTQEQRRAYDTSRPPRRPGKQRSVPEVEEVPRVVSVAPDKLAALGYVPARVNFLFAARVPELLASPLGMQVLHNPIQQGESSFRLENLPKWLGLRLEDIDHVVFAAQIDDTVPPPFFLVLRTTGPYDEEQLRQHVKGTRVPSPSKKTIYAFRVPQQDIPLNAWFADAHTVVLALLANQLEPLPNQPSADLHQLSGELRTILKQRRESVAPVWIAGHSPDWRKSWAAVILNRMKKEDLEKVASLRTFGVFFVPTRREETQEEFLIVKGALACKDESGARKIDEYFRALRRPDADLKTVLDGPWLTLQFQTSPDFLARILKR